MKRKNPEIKDEWLNDLVSAFSQINDKKKMRQFIEEIFTPAERRDFSLRWRLMQLLRDGMPQRQIAEALKISLCKITRGSKVLKNHNSVASNILKPDSREKKS